MGKRNLLVVACIAVLATLVFVLNGCAGLGSQMPADEKVCSDSPRHSVATFLRGVTEFSLSLLKGVVLGGVNILAVFGGGSVERGREVVRSIVDHPEVHRGNEVDSVYSFVSMTGDGNEYDVLVERRARVIFVDENMRVEDEIYRRSFHVAFHPLGHCIAAIYPTEAAWVRVGTPAGAR